MARHQRHGQQEFVFHQLAHVHATRKGQNVLVALRIQLRSQLLIAHEAERSIERQQLCHRLEAALALQTDLRLGLQMKPDLRLATAYRAQLTGDGPVHRRPAAGRRIPCGRLGETLEIGGRPGAAETGAIARKGLDIELARVVAALMAAGGFGACIARTGHTRKCKVT